ncbi:MAG: adenine phosphoribosyltransferase [Oscillospiraceae bacterium]|nr:adenine phosphoribosyltransferase [Oscillospiraceae bacterium]
MQTYNIDIAGLKRDLPICPLNENLSIGAFVIFGDVELTVHAAKKLLEKMPTVDYLIAPEAKAIPLVYEMSRQSGIPYIIARKKAKAYMTGVLEVTVQSITTAGAQTLILDTAEGEAMKGKRIGIVDDVISTGESLRAVEALVNEVGGLVEARMAVLAEGDAAARKDIIVLAPLPLFRPDGTPLL